MLMKLNPNQKKARTFQEQPSSGVLSKSCAENMQQIYRRTPMSMCDFNKVAKQSNFIEIALRHGSSPVNLLHIFRTPCTKNTSGWLLPRDIYVFTVPSSVAFRTLSGI